MNGFSRRLSGSIYSLVVLVTFVACSGNSEKPPARVEAAFDSFYQFQDDVVRSDPSTNTATSKIHTRYRALFSPYQTSAMVRQLRPDDVALLFRAADLDFFFTVSATTLADMQLDLAELSRRGIARTDNDAKLYAALVESRSFKKARAFAKLHPLASDEAVPDVVDNVVRKGPTTLLVMDGGRKLVRKSVDLEEGRRIVVISSPLCHFCQRAIRSIETDAVLRRLVLDHATWIVPQDRSTSFATVANWNRLHPNETMEFTYRREEWPMVDRWETPVFYFFKNGHVVSKVSGWPVAGRKAEISRSLRLAGLR